MSRLSAFIIVGILFIVGCASSLPIKDRYNQLKIEHSQTHCATLMNCEAKGDKLICTVEK